MSKHTSIKPRFLVLTVVSVLAACSSDVVDLGGGTVTQNLALGSRCTESAIVDENVIVESQEGLEALLGCEEIRGNLTVQVFEGTDLRPLRRLRAINGELVLGASPNGLVDLTELTEEELQEQRVEADGSQQIIAAGWLESLAGLESLERVGALILLGVSAPDLRAFESLRNLSGHAHGGRPGRVALANMKNLVDLGGLEGATGISWLDVSSSPELESLDGLQFGFELDQLNLQSSPKLADLDALAPVEVINGIINLWGIGVENLGALENLYAVWGGIGIEENLKLTNADGLASLAATDFLVFNRNPKLTHLPSFPGLDRIDGFEAVGNAELRSLSLEFAELLNSNLVQDGEFETSSGIIEVGDNPQLQTLTFTSGFKASQGVAIYRNERLERVDLGSLERLDRLSINGNPSLTEVAVGQLQTVDQLSVLENPLLSTTELRSVRTFESELSGNADDASHSAP